MIFMSLNIEKNKKVHVALTQEDHDRLSKLAEQEGRSRPGYLRWLLHRHFREVDGK